MLGMWLAGRDSAFDVASACCSQPGQPHKQIKIVLGLYVIRAFARIDCFVETQTPSLDTG